MQHAFLLSFMKNEVILLDPQEQKYIAMTQPPEGRIICRLAVPCIISMLVTAFYNMADTFFVGMLKSNAATGAVGVVFSMMAIIQAVGFFFGHGSGNYISRAMGQKHYADASTMAATGFFLAIGAGFLICVLGQIFLEPLSYFLGSTDSILPYTKDYLRIILLGAPWMTASLVLNNQLRFQGSATYAMVGITCGAVLNIALDPLMIFVLDMKVAGAGLATILSQLVSFFVLLAGCSRGGNIRIRFRNARLNLHYITQIVRGGLPSLARQSIASIATICLNNAARPYGDVVIAAMSVVQRVMQFGASAMIGFGQGFQPFCGFNYGAKLMDRVKKGFWFCVKSSFVFLCVIAALVFLFAPQLVAIFRDDPDVIACGALALRLQCCSFPFQSFIVMSNMMQQVIGKTGPATFLALARQGVFFIPAVLLLPLCWGVLGIQMAQAISDLCTLLCAIPLQMHILRSLSRES